MRQEASGVPGKSAHALTNDVAQLGEVAQRPTVERALAAVSEFLGMDVAYATEFVDAILKKHGALTEDEWEIMRGHPISSERLIRTIPGLSHLAAAVRAEHERWDGSGYPDGLAGETIPLASRITLVCDAYHAITSDRPYRHALTPAQARAEIAAGSGSPFCPSAAQALLDVLAEPAAARTDGSVIADVGLEASPGAVRSS